MQDPREPADRESAPPGADARRLTSLARGAVRAVRRRRRRELDRTLQELAADIGVPDAPPPADRSPRPGAGSP